MIQPKLLWFQVIFVVICNNINAQERTKPHSIFRDSLDNAYDMSDWLVNKKGVLLT